MAGDIRGWLEGLGLDNYAEAFVENGVDLRALPHLSEDDLKELGVLLGHRRILLAAIASVQDQGRARHDGQPSSEPSSRSEAERRQLTVMFCDLVGSTALSARLDPEDLREVMRRYQDTVAGVVARFEGHVAKFLGDGVLAFFGWPRAYEDQAERAVRSGMAAVQAVANLATADGQALAAHVGIATGVVVIGDMVGEAAREADAVVGETPNLAARLQDVAAPGQVVIGSATRRLIGEALDLEDIGTHRLKGFAEPVAAWRVLGESAAETRFEAAHPGVRTELVGREHELGLLGRAWQQSQQGVGQVVLINGEPGIGKSRLVDALSANLGDQEYTRITLGCSPYHTNSALYPLIAHFERLLSWQREDSAEEKLARLEEVLKAASLPLDEVVVLFAALLSLPLADDRYPPLDLTPQLQKQQTLDAIVAWLLEEAERRPVLQVWEDLHWADPSTLELLALTIEQAPTAPILTVLTFRPEFQPPWPQRSHMTPLTLNRLERLEAAALITQQAGGKALPEAVVEHIVDKTDGVPLYVEELTKAILETDVLREHDGGYRLTGPMSAIAIPATLQDSLMARLDRLPEIREVAQFGAVLGREFGYEMVRAIASVGETKLQRGLARLVDAELLYQRGRPPRARYVFKHALVQDAAYDSLLFSRRRELHAQVVRTIEQLHRGRLADQSELLAYHAVRAELWDDALRHCLVAGQRANERSAYQEALRLLDAGLEAANRVSESDETIRLAIEVRLNLRPCLGAFGQYERLLKAFSEVAKLANSIGDAYTATVARIDTTHLLYQSGYVETAIEEGRQAVRMASELGDRRLMVGATANLAMGYFFRGRFREAIETTGRYADDLKGIFRHDRLGTTATSSVNWLSNLGGMHAMLGGFDTALAFSADARAIADETGKPFDRAMANQWYCFVLTNAGRYQEAMQQGKQGLDVANSGGFEFLQAWAGCFYGIACCHMGQPQAALEILRNSHHLSNRLGLIACRIWCVAGLALASIESRSPDAGRRYAEEALDLSRKHHCEWFELLALQHLGLSNAMPEASPSDRSESLWLEAMALAERIEARPDLAHCQRHLGAYYTGIGRSNQAAVHLAAARDIYHELGMSSWRSRTEALLAG